MFVIEVGLVLFCLLSFVVLFGHKQWVRHHHSLQAGWQDDYPWRSGLGQWVLLAAVIVYIRLVGIELSMLLATLFCGLSYGFEKCFLQKRRLKPAPKWWQEVVDFFPLLFLVWAVRSFVIQPYRVPSDSLRPTLLPGDFLVVNQLAYGMRFPITHWTLWQREGPKRGDVVVFHPPHNPELFYVKRTIGLPGDRITYRHKTLFINGEAMKQTLVDHRQVHMPDITDQPIAIDYKQEQLMDVTHSVYLTSEPDVPFDPGRTWVVPEGHYFMMGDNRDFSGDSRIWGPVPSDHLVGQVSAIFLSLDFDAWQKRAWQAVLRWHRMFERVH